VSIPVTGEAKMTDEAIMIKAQLSQLEWLWSKDLQDANTKGLLTEQGRRLVLAEIETKRDMLRKIWRAENE
jgi:hypothetical protein